MQDSFYNGSDFLIRLKISLEDSRSQFVNKKDNTTINELGLIAACFIVAAACLYLTQGYQGGFLSINRISHLFPSDFLQMLTFLGDTLVCLALLLPFARRNPAMLVIALLTAVYGSLLCQGMKSGFDMPRPPAVLHPQEFFLTGKELTRHSFPSGHSLTIFSLLTLFYYFASHVSTKVLLVMFGSAVAISRVLVGSHWPIDVFIGSALGILTTLAAIYSAKHWPSGFSIPVHGFVLALVISAVFMLFDHNGGYPDVTLFAATLSSITLVHFFFDYILFFMSVEVVEQSLERDR